MGGGHGNGAAGGGAPVASLDAVIFVASGIASTILAQFLINGGAGDAWTGLLPLANYGGMCLIALLPEAWLAHGPQARVVAAGPHHHAPAPAPSARRHTPPPSTAAAAHKRRHAASGGGDASASTTPGRTPPTSPPATHRSSSLALVAAAAADVEHGDSPRRRAGGDSSSDDERGGGAGERASLLLPPGKAAVATASSNSSGSGGSHSPSTVAPPSPWLPCRRRAPTAPPPPPLWVAVPAIVGLDIAGFLLSVGGMAYAGSGTYQVLYSSVVVWAALGAYVFMGRTLTPRQAGGVAAVMAGLALSSLAGSGGGGGGRPSSPAGALSPSSVLLGSGLSVACAMTYGAVYVLSEAVSRAPDYPGPRGLAWRVGAGIVGVLAAYIAVAVAPRWRAVAARLAAAGRLTPGRALALYAALAASSAAHSATYFKLVARSGAAATGIFSSLRAVGVFLASHPLFCAAQPAQCLTPGRAAASAVVVAGVLAFSWSSGGGGGGGPPPPHAHEGRDEEGCEGGGGGGDDHREAAAAAAESAR